MTSRISPKLRSVAGVWKDVLQRPVEISQLLTTPAESHERAIPSFVCSLTDVIGAEASNVGSEPVAAGSISEVPNCQSLTDPP